MVRCYLRNSAELQWAAYEICSSALEAGYSANKPGSLSLAAVDCKTGGGVKFALVLVLVAAWVEAAAGIPSLSVAFELQVGPRCLAVVGIDFLRLLLELVLVADLDKLSVCCS